MTIEDLDRIDRDLKVLVVRPADTARARNIALTFNAEVQQARARLACVRTTHAESRVISPELAVELEAYAVMYAVERERIVRQWGLALTN